MHFNSLEFAVFLPQLFFVLLVCGELEPEIVEFFIVGVSLTIRELWMVYVRFYVDCLRR